MNRPAESRAAEGLIIAGVALAFLDETIRKALPGAPVTVTAAKDVLIFLAGMVVIFQVRCVPQRYLKQFLPWVLVATASALWVLSRFYSLMGLAATIRTYSLCPLLFAAGYYLGLHDRARRRVSRVFLVGGLAAVAVAFAQEYARDSLPGMLSTRIYKERHSGAGGDYIESLFASPQTLSQVALVLGAWSFAALALPSLSRRLLSPFFILLASLATTYLSRIRTGLIVLGIALALIWLGVWKVETPPGHRPAPLRGIVVGLAVLLLASTFYLVIYPELSETSGEEVTRDIRFYEMVFDFELIKYRAGLFLLEFQTSGEHDWFFGNGAGTGGRTRGYLDVEFYDIPAVSDTGLYLLYHEMGMLGLVSFLWCYGGLILICAFPMLLRRTIPPVSIPAFAVGATILFWFLFKSHACIANGLSHILWMGSIGLCCAALDRQRREEGAFRAGRAVLTEGPGGT